VFLCSKLGSGPAGNGEIEHNLFEIDEKKNRIFGAKTVKNRGKLALLSTGLLK
jgi:hypothetical protein